MSKARYEVPIQIQGTVYLHQPLVDEQGVRDLEQQIADQITILVYGARYALVISDDVHIEVRRCDGCLELHTEQEMTYENGSWTCARCERVLHEKE